MLALLRRPVRRAGRERDDRRRSSNPCPSTRSPRSRRANRVERARSRRRARAGPQIARIADAVGELHHARLGRVGLVRVRDRRDSCRRRRRAVAVLVVLVGVARDRAVVGRVRDAVAVEVIGICIGAPASPPSHAPSHATSTPSATTALGFGAWRRRARLARLRRMRAWRPHEGPEGSAADSPQRRTKLPDGPPLVTPGERMSYRSRSRASSSRPTTSRVGDVTEVAGKHGDRRAGPREGGRPRRSSSRTSTTASPRGSTSTPAGRCGGPDRRVRDQAATDIERPTRDIAGAHRRHRPGRRSTSTTSRRRPSRRRSRCPTSGTTTRSSSRCARGKAPAGTTVTAEVLRSRYLWHVDDDDRRQGEARHRRSASSRRCASTATRTSSTATAREFPDSDERDFSIWISDDDGRVPLKIVAQHRLRRHRDEITDYQPGTGQHLAGLVTVTSRVADPQRASRDSAAYARLEAPREAGTSRAVPSRFPL